MAASRMARSGERARARSASSAKSIIMMAFFLTIPMRRMIPISEIRVNGMPAAQVAASAPTPAEGKVERMVSGWR